MRENLADGQRAIVAYLPKDQGEVSHEDANKVRYWGAPLTTACLRSSQFDRHTRSAVGGILPAPPSLPSTIEVIRGQYHDQKKSAT
jgi:hypothetical protein